MLSKLLRRARRPDSCGRMVVVGYDARRDARVWARCPLPDGHGVEHAPAPSARDLVQAGTAHPQS